MSNSVSYGTAQPTAVGRNGNGPAADDEGQPLLRKPASRPLLARWRKQLTVEVSRDWADVVLLLCYVVTGLLDSASTQVWGAFVSMQTGM